MRMLYAYTAWACLFLFVGYASTFVLGGCPKSRIAPFAIVYFGKKYYLTVAKKQTL